MISAFMRLVESYSKRTGGNRGNGEKNISVSSVTSCWRGTLSLADHEDHKRTGLVGASAALALTGRSGFLLCGAQVDRVRFGIESHGPGARLGLYVSHDGKLVRRFFLNDGQRAVAIRAECQLGVRIKDARIGAFPDRWCGDDLASVGVEDRHFFIVASNEQTTSSSIHSHAGRFV